MQKKTQRRKERELALWGLFRNDFEGDDKEPISELLADFPAEETVEELKNTSGAYADAVVQAYNDNAEAVDALISSHLKSGWSLDRLPKTEKAVLRLAVTEMLMTPDPVPKEIAINEALELAKKYGEDGGTRYINGILNAIARENGQ